MSRTCSYFMCSNTSDTKSMFRFPSHNTNRLNVWLKNCGNMTLAHLSHEQLRNKYVCVDHFNNKYVRKSSPRRAFLLKNAVPIHFRDFEILEQLRPPPDCDQSKATVRCGRPDKDYTRRRNYFCLECKLKAASSLLKTSSHQNHFVLKIPDNSKDSKVFIDLLKKVIKSTKQDDQSEANVTIKTEVEEFERTNTVVGCPEATAGSTVNIDLTEDDTPSTLQVSSGLSLGLIPEVDSEEHEMREIEFLNLPNVIGKQKELEINDEGSLDPLNAGQSIVVKKEICDNGFLDPPDCTGECHVIKQEIIDEEFVQSPPPDGICDDGFSDPIECAQHFGSES